MNSPVVLINPPAEQVQEVFYDEPNYPAIGIAYVAGYLERHTPVVPRVVDGKLERLTPGAVAARVAELAPAVVGLTAMTHMVSAAARLAARIKELSPRTHCVLGGFHATFMPERTLREYPAFDSVVVGEGEIAFARLVTCVLAGREPRDIPGVWHRTGDGVADGGRGEIPDRLDDLGAPAWHLFDRDAMSAHVDVLPVISQRGCPFACSFCSRPYGRTVRARSPRKVVDEIESGARTFGVRKFEFYDETFTVDKAHVTALCEEILRRGLDLNFRSLVHASTLDRPLLELMKRAGCDDICMGVESGNPEQIRRMNKGTSRALIAGAVEALKDVGIPFSTTFILGHPDETMDSLLDTIEFARELDPPRAAFGIMVPYPGTEIWKLATRGEGGYRMISDDWDAFNKHFGGAVELEQVPRHRLELMKLLAYLAVFFPTETTARVLRNLRGGSEDAVLVRGVEQQILAAEQRARREDAAPDGKRGWGHQRLGILQFLRDEFAKLQDVMARVPASVSADGVEGSLQDYATYTGLAEPRVY